MAVEICESSRQTKRRISLAVGAKNSEAYMKVAMTSVTSGSRYRVRQIFCSFDCECEKTFDSAEEAEAYGRALAGDLAQTFFQASDDYADVPLRSPFNAMGYANETDFFVRLCEHSSILVDKDCCPHNLGPARRIRWSELVNLIYEAAITIELA
jgi:hypothetical protein